HAGLSDRKGRIAVGLDADFVVWDPEEDNCIDAEKLHFRNKLTPYHERSCKGLVYQTIVRGSTAYDLSLVGEGSDLEKAFSYQPYGQWIDSPIYRSDN
ncbi:Allantoinase, partial [Coemansia sp. S610]